MRKDAFEILGGYEEGIYVRGGEQTEFSIKMRAYGGHVVMVYYSRVRQMYRIHIEDTGRSEPAIPQTLTDNLGLRSEDQMEVRVHRSPKISQG